MLSGLRTKKGVKTPIIGIMSNWNQIPNSNSNSKSNSDSELNSDSKTKIESKTDSKLEYLPTCSAKKCSATVHLHVSKVVDCNFASQKALGNFRYSIETRATVYDDYTVD